MKRFYFCSIIMIGIIIISGCQNSADEPSREFYTNFSIGEIVVENEAYLLPGSRGSNGSESGPPEPFIQRYEEINFQIDEANQDAFLSAVKMDIQAAIIDSGATIQGYGQGGGVDTEYFSFDYLHDQIFGTILVWAVKGPGSNMNIIVLLTED